jgi:hypothetical protein
MRRPIIALLILSCFLSWRAFASDAEVKGDAPDRYVVVKGDTLWGISGRFLKEPWRWPEIWKLNKEEIKNPHWIYPGDVVVLDRLPDGSARLRLVKAQKYNGHEVVVLSPQVRVEPHPETGAIPAISPADIGPFLSQPLVIEKDGLETAPEIVASEENRVVIGAGSRAYVSGLKKGDPTLWQIFRPGKALVDPQTKETLGYEAIYLGEARVTSFGPTSTIEVVRSTQEINRGDRLVAAREANLSNFVPHAPDTAIRGQIIATYEGVAEAGRDSIVTLNRGTKDGLESGDVLAIHRLGQEVAVTAPPGEAKPLRSWDQKECLKKDAKVSFNEFYDRSKVWEPCKKEMAEEENPTVTLPEERYGLVLVFRTFDRVSYALIVQSNAAVHVDDIVTNP